MLFHFRTHAGHEVDIVLEEPGGRLIGIEVKAGATVGRDDFHSLRALNGLVGKRFHRGVRLHTGRESLRLGAGLQALPVDVLWQAGRR